MTTALLLALALAVPAPPQASSIYQRPTTVRIMIGGAARDRAGDYSSTGVASLCGEIPKESSLTGEASFVIEYPGEGKVTTIAFGSNQLVGTVTKANKFRLSLGVVNAQGGRPPQFVLNTDTGQKGNSGVATLTKGKTGVTLTVMGENDMKETIALTLTCS
jgi:hypothetical protein